MHLFRSYAVHAPLGLAHQLERPHRPLPHPLRDGRPRHQAHQLPHVAPVRLLRDHEFDLLAPDAAAYDVAHGDPHSGESQAVG